MKKILTLFIVAISILMLHTSCIFADGDNSGSSKENAIEGVCSINATSPTEISCQQSDIINNQNAYVYLVFIDENTHQEYQSHHLSRGMNQAIIMGGQKIMLQQASSPSRDILPRAYYDIYLRVTKWDDFTNSNIETWFKVEENPDPTSPTTPFQIGPLFNEVPALEISSDGENIKIECVDSDANRCSRYFASLQSSSTANLNIFEIKQDLSQENIFGISNWQGNVFETVVGENAVQITNDSIFNKGNFMGPATSITNKKVVIGVVGVNGYVSFADDINSLTINAPKGTLDNPITGCTISRVPNSSEPNDFVVTCDGSLNPDVILTDTTNKTLFLVEKNEQLEKTGTTYTPIGLVPVYNYSTKELSINQTMLQSSRISKSQQAGYKDDAYLPQGKYDVYFEKFNSMGQGGSGVFYLLGTNVEFDQAKIPAPELSVTNDSENNILISCKDVNQECSEWLEAVYHDITPRTRAMGGGATIDEGLIRFSTNDSNDIQFTKNINTGIIETVYTNGLCTALKIPANKVASTGLENKTYSIEVYVYPYVRARQENFMPNVVLLDASQLLDKITFSQESIYPFNVSAKASDEASFDYLKNSMIEIHDQWPSSSSFNSYIGRFEAQYSYCDDASKTCIFSAPLMNYDKEEVTATFIIDSPGYEREYIRDFNLRILVTKLVETRLVLASNGIQLYSDDEDFLKMLTGQKEIKYPDEFGYSFYIFNDTDSSSSFWIEDSDITNIFGTTIYENTISYPDPDHLGQMIELHKYVLINPSSLAEVELDKTKEYSFFITFPREYLRGVYSSNTYIGLSNAYFKGLSEDHGYDDMTDEENLDILGIILGMDATDNNPNTIKKIYKEVYKKGNTANLNIDMPEVVGAIIERENETGGFSKENLEYLDANQVELGITFDNLDEADLEEGFKKFKVEKTDVGFEVTLTNKYINDDGTNKTNKKVDDIKELPQEAVITFDLPDEELEEGKEYMLLTIHNGNPKLIKIKVEKDPTTGKNIGTALVSEFSPFMVVEVDKSTEGSKPTTGSSNGSYFVPNTGIK